MKKVLVTPRSVTKAGHPALKRLTGAGFEVIFSTPGVQPGEAELLEKLPGCAGYLAGVERVSARVLEAAAGTLKAIARNGVGIDNVDLDAARRLGIRVLPAAGANSRGVAELTIALILALARAIPFSDAHLKARDWQRREGVELEGKTLGLIGCGRIGAQVARMARGLGMTVLACDPYPPPALPEGMRLTSLDEVLATSDFLSLHCPAAAEGKPLIDSRALGNTKRGAYLINTARASLLDAGAVVAALDDGRLAGLAIDVFENEPPGDDPLALHPKVIATPHIGGYTRESVDRAVGAAVENLLQALSD